MDYYGDQTPIYIDMEKPELTEGEESEVPFKVYRGSPRNNTGIDFFPWGVDVRATSNWGKVRVAQSQTHPNYPSVFFKPNTNGTVFLTAYVDYLGYTNRLYAYEGSHLVTTLIWTIGPVSVVIGAVAVYMIAKGGESSDPDVIYVETIEEAINRCQDGDAIMLSPGLYKGLGNVGLNINKNIAILSNPNQTGDVIIDGEENSWIWNISSTNITILGLTFLNGKTEGDGAALKFNEPLENCTIISNFYSNNAANGGAIYFASNGGNISYCDFSSNNALYDGGSVYFSDGGTIINNTFSYNIASRGGAVFVTGDLVNENNTFFANSADEGKDIYVAGNRDIDLRLTVENVAVGKPVIFEVNTDRYYSGLIPVYVNGVSYNVDVVNGYGNATASFALGTYNASAVFRGNDVFKPMNASCEFEVYEKHMKDPELSVSIKNVSAGQPILIEINANMTFSAEVSVVFDFDLSVVYTVDVVNGYGNITIESLDVGKHTAIAYWDGTDDFYGGINTTEFEVYEKGSVDPEIDIDVPDVIVAGTDSIEINANSEFNDKVYVQFNCSDEILTVEIIDGHGEIPIKNLAVGNYTATIRFEGNDVFKNFTKSFEFEISPKELIDPCLSVDVGNVTVGEAVLIKIYANETINDELELKVNDSDEIHIVHISGGYGEIEITGLALGNYSVTVTFNETDTFKNSTARAEFEVCPKDLIDPDLSVNVQSVSYGESVFIEIITNNTFYGNVSLNVNDSDEIHTVYVIEGYAYLEIPDLAVGSYLATAVFNETDVFKNSTASAEFEVYAKELIDPNLSVGVSNVTVGESVLIEIFTNDTFSGNVTVKVNGSDLRTVEIIEGYGNTVFEGLSVGNYTATVRFNETEIFRKSKAKAEFEVCPKEWIDPNLSVSISNVTVGEPVLVEIRTNDTFSGYVDLTLNSSDEIHQVKISNGYGEFEISGLDIGKYTVTVLFNETDIFKNSTASAEFEVREKDLINPNLKINARNITFGEIVLIELSTNEAFSGNVTLLINNSIKVYVNISEGYGNFTIDGLDAGKYRAFAIFHKTDIFKESIKMAKFEVSPENAELNLSVANVIYGDTVKINVKVTCNGEPLSAGKISTIINNRVYTADVVNGNAVICVSGLNAGSYSGNVSFDGGSNYVNSIAKFSFKVSKQNAAITARNKAYVINYGGKYSITLKDAKGKVLSNKNVTFILAGKTIGSVKTNSKGVATIKLSAKVLKKVKAGKKNLIIKFAGDDNYNALSKKLKVTVKKEKTKLIAKKKVFKRTLKTKKYRVILKNSKGKAIKKVKITLRVKGKTYKAKTNKKGKAVFKIKKLNRKGKYNAKIKFKGNRYYKAVSKKAKITIK